MLVRCAVKDKNFIDQYWGTVTQNGRSCNEKKWKKERWKEEIKFQGHVNVTFYVFDNIIYDVPTPSIFCSHLKNLI